MGTNTATIETLTAEVRVLMVGSRQVTLSVARQLDRVKIDEISPFGRVKLDKDSDRYCLIGKHFETGVLVLATGPKMFEPINSRPPENQGALASIASSFSKSAWDEWDRESDIRKYVQGLPLIVLAGLK